MIYLTAFNESLIRAADYYDNIHKLLARRFVDAVDEATDKIDRFPRVGRQVKTYRMLPLKDFPFSICYIANARGEPVALVLHHHKQRNPQIS